MRQDVLSMMRVVLSSTGEPSEPASGCGPCVLAGWKLAAALLGGVIAALAPMPAHACKMDGPHRFEVAVIRVASMPIHARVSAELVRKSSFPLAPCALESAVVFRVDGLPPGAWGLVVKAAGSSKLPLPAWPMDLGADRTAVVSWSDSFGPWRSGLDEQLEVSLVDAQGQQSAAHALHVSAYGSPQWLGWMLVLVLVGVRWWRRRRERERSRLAPPAKVLRDRI